MSAHNNNNALPDLLIAQTMQHLATMVEAFGPNIPPGQAMAIMTDRYRISIQPRLIITPTGLATPQG